MAKEYDAQEIDVIVDDEQVADLDSVGYDQSKDHTLERTLDEGAIWVKATGQYELTVVVKATSESRVTMEDLFADDVVFGISIKYAEEEPRDESVFVQGMLNSFGPSDYELDGLPTYEGSYECEEVLHN